MKVLKFDRGEGPRLARHQAARAGPLGERRPSDIRWAAALIGRVVNVADYGAFVELEPASKG